MKYPYPYCAHCHYPGYRVLEEPCPRCGNYVKDMRTAWDIYTYRLIDLVQQITINKLTGLDLLNWHRHAQETVDQLVYAKPFLDAYVEEKTQQLLAPRNYVIPMDELNQKHPLGHCCFCREQTDRQTRLADRSKEEQVLCCQRCANAANPEDVPSKKDWVRREHVANSTLKDTLTTKGVPVESLPGAEGYR